MNGRADSAQSERRMFRFTTTTEKPTHRVACLSCGWTATGSNAKVWEKADAHTTCPPERGTRWVRDGWRGAWRVKTVGPKWVTLTPPIVIHGYANTVQTAVAEWPGPWREA